MTRVYVSIGSNVEAERNLRLAVDQLRRRFGRLHLSPVYRSAPVGFDGDDFLNMVAGFDTRLSPGRLRAEFEQVHALAGRRRSAWRFEARPLDIDLLLYGTRVDAAERLPREDVLRYGFVLRPLADLAPRLRHPSTGRAIACHWRDAGLAAEPLERVAIDLGLPD